MTTEDEADPVVTETVERALDPYRGVLTPEMLEVFRAELTHALSTHPVAKRLTSRLRERAPQERSGDVETPEGEKERAEKGDAAKAKSGTKP